ncbi:MAG: Lar family restriction alleviation protein [Candidatus Hydrogenedentes bacterium]|nr:Lar family restriction alleviation protein [Candidatus Hydrogenedentota bacterium]
MSPSVQRYKHHTWGPPALLPCPFCGDAHVQIQPYDHVSSTGRLFGYRVFCLCGAQVDEAGYTHHEDFDQRALFDAAVALWNTRAQ